MSIKSSFHLVRPHVCEHNPWISKLVVVYIFSYLYNDDYGKIVIEGIIHMVNIEFEFQAHHEIFI